MPVRRLLGGVTLVVVAVGGAGLAGCGGSSSPVPEPSTTVATTTALRVDEFPAAVQAVEAARGGLQQYSEINASPEGVNLFRVLPDGTEVAELFHDGTLDPPGAPQARSSDPFAATGVDLSLAAKLVLDTQQRFPGSMVVSAALLMLPDQGLRWALRSRSARGGLLDVLYTPAGDLVSVAPAD